MKLTSSFATLASVVVLALCLGQAQADSVEAPLGLTYVDDKGVPVTPLTYLNLAPAAHDLSSAAKKLSTPPPMLHEPKKRLLPIAKDQLQPVVEKFTSQGLSIRGEVGHSLIPSLPILGTLDNEGDHTNMPASAPVQKRLLDALNSLEPSQGTQFMPENQQELGQRTPHPLNRREEDPIKVDILGKTLPDLIPTKLPSAKRQESNSGISLFGENIPLKPITLPNSKRSDSPIDLGLQTGNKQDLAAAQSLLKSLLPTRREATTQPVELGLHTGNAQDLQRAEDFFNDLLAGSKRDGAPLATDTVMTYRRHFAANIDRFDEFLKSYQAKKKRDTISPNNIDLSSVKKLGEAAVSQATKDAVPVALAPIKQAVSPAVEVVKTANALCTSFNCAGMVQGAAGSVMKDLPIPGLPHARALGDEDPFAGGLLNNQGEVSGIPVKRDQNPAVQMILDTSDGARDEILALKDKVDNAAGEFVKNMYTKHGEIQTRGAINLPSYSLLPGAGPPARKAAKELIDFIGLPIPGVAKRMEKVRRKE